eukprot:contig_27279_g6710
MAPSLLCRASAFVPAAPVGSSGLLPAIAASTTGARPARTPLAVPRRCRRPSAGAAARPVVATATAEKFSEVRSVNQTGGGWIVQLVATNGKKSQTRHTIIISKEAMTRLTADGTPVTPGMLAKYIMSYLLNINATTNTEGMIESDIFPVNYFPIRQFLFFYPDSEAKLIEMINSQAVVA